MEKRVLLFSVLIATVISGFFYYSNLFATPKPEIPGAKVLLVVKDDDGKLIEGATVKVEIFFEGKNSIYNYDYEIVMIKNPDLVGFCVGPNNVEATVKFTAKKAGFSLSEVLSLKNIDFWERIKRGNGVAEEVITNSEIPDSVKNEVLNLAKEAASLLVFKLKKNLEEIKSISSPAPK